MRTSYRRGLPALLAALCMFAVAACATDEATAPGDETNVEDVVDTAVGEGASDDSQGSADADTGEGADDGTEPVLLKVGSKDFTEEYLVAEMYALLLENAGFAVERVMSLGGTPVAHQAILAGDIDLYPEYSSTGLLTVLQLEPLKDAEAIMDAVRSGYEEAFELTWLDPAPFNNSQALATTLEISEQYGIKTFSDLAQNAAELRLGGPAEFSEREDGLPGLQATYGGFEFDEFVQLGSGPLRYDALKGGEIDVVVAFGTDGRIAGDGLVLLEDDLKLYPIYQIAPVVRMEILEANPAIADALNPLAPLLTDSTMATLNYQVDVEGLEYPDVARDFLLANGLIE